MQSTVAETTFNHILPVHHKCIKAYCKPCAGQYFLSRLRERGVRSVSKTSPLRLHSLTVRISSSGTSSLDTRTAVTYSGAQPMNADGTV